MKVNATLHTDGKGWWSSKTRAVRIIELRVPYIDDEYSWGELRVYFDRNDWNVDSDGLIYTDNLFEKELGEFLTTVGLDPIDVGYSEQGMQGDYFVSFDVEDKFLASWREKTAVAA